MKRIWILSCVAALAAGCSSSPDVADGGTDASVAKDSTTQDAPSVDASADVVGDAANDWHDATVVLEAGPSDPWGLFDAKDGGTGMLNAVAVDGTSHVLLGGCLSNTEFFLEARVSDGGLAWQQAIAATGIAGGSTCVYAVAFDASGNAYASGVVQSGHTVDVGGGAIGNGAFIVKFDASGNFVWQCGPYASTFFSGVAVKSNGNLVLTGGISGSDDYGGGTVTSNGSADALMVEITSANQFVRAKTWGDTGLQGAVAISIDALDDIFLAGRFFGTIDFGGGAITAGNQGDAFIAKLDPTGAYLHQTQLHGNPTFVSIATDPNGNVFVGGTLDPNVSVDLGGGALTKPLFVGKLDGNLAHQWSSSYGNTVNAQCRGVASDPSGAVTLTGFYEGSVDFGAGDLPAVFGLFVARFDGSGKLLGNFGSGDDAGGGVLPSAIVYLSAPDFVIVGSGAGPVHLPSGVLVGGGAFAARLSP